MARLISVLRGTAAAVAVALLTTAQAPAAPAAVSYDSLAELTLTLTSVLDLDETPVSGGWQVNALGELLHGSESTAGTASADFDYDLAAAGVLAVGDSVFQSSSSFGWADNGMAKSAAQTDLSLVLDNDSGQTLVFNFDYAAVLDAWVTGDFWSGDDAFAIGGIEVVDELGIVDILVDVRADVTLPLSDSGDRSGSFSILLEDGGSDLIAAGLDTEGYAYAGSGFSLDETAPVSEPASLALLVLGLAGIGLLRHRPRGNKHKSA